MNELPFKRMPAFIVPPTNAPDLTSGMQQATANGTIGLVVTVVDVFAPGAVIGGPIEPEFHRSIPRP